MLLDNSLNKGKKMKLIGVAGQRGSGKDTFAEALRPEWEHLKFAAPLKAMLRTLLYSAHVPSLTIDQMLDGTLKETPHPVLGNQTPRHAMQTLGTEWRNLLSETLWTSIMEGKLSTMSGWSVVISDVRFHHEVEMIRKFGGTVVLLQRGPWSLDPHPSEAQVPFLDHDHYFSNTGTITELEEFAQKIAKGL